MKTLHDIQDITAIEYHKGQLPSKEIQYLQGKSTFETIGIASFIVLPLFVFMLFAPTAGLLFWEGYAENTRLSPLYGLLLGGTGIAVVLRIAFSKPRWEVTGYDARGDLISIIVGSKALAEQLPLKKGVRENTKREFIAAMETLRKKLKTRAIILALQSMIIALATLVIASGHVPSWQ